MSVPVASMRRVISSICSSREEVQRLLVDATSNGLRSLGFSGSQKASGRSSCQSAGLNSLFIVEVCFRVPGEEAGAADVFAGLVHGDVVGLEDVVGYGTEPLGVVAFGQIDFNNPFEAVSGGTAEEEAGLELGVVL